MTTRKTGPYKATSPHPDCPPGKPHATVHTPTGEVIKCHPTPKDAQDLAVTLNIPDATTPAGSPAIIPASAGEVEAESPAPHPGNAEKLREYWTHGPGAAKIRWGEGGDWQRCVDHLGKYIADPKGYCELRHKEATGMSTSEHAALIKGHKAAADTAASNPNHQPAGSPTGGQFAPGGGGGATPTNANPVQQGMTGKQVSDLQTRLNALGAKPPLKVDGKFGPATLAAVKAYQSAHGLKVDGLVGPKTTTGLRMKQQTPAKPATTPKKTAPKKTPAPAKTKTPAKTTTPKTPAKPKAPAKPATTPKKTTPAPAKTKTPAPKTSPKSPIPKAPAKPKTLTPQQAHQAHQAHLAHLAHLRHLHGAAGNQPATLPALITIPGVDILATGTWQLSSGRQTFTRADLTAATEAASCPAVGPPVIKIGHLDDRFTPDPSHDGEPAIGKITNLRADPTGNKLIGDMAGMPGWLGAVAASAFPRRSVEGTYNFPCQIGHTHPFVITAVALLGVTPPGVGVLGGLDDIAALYGLTSTAASSGWRTPPADQEGHPMAVTEEDVRRAYYAAGDAPPSWWITELQMDPTQLIVADEQTTKVYRVPFHIDGAAIEFGDPQEFATYSDVAAARGTGPLIVFASAAESRSVTAAAPYEVRTGMPGCDGHAVVDTATGKMVPKGCHPDRGSADAQMMQMMKGKGGMAAAGTRLDRLRKIRAAVGDNADVAKLAASLDALLDQATEMCKGMDRGATDPMMVQMTDMMAAAEELADQLMDALGIPDPDEAGETPVAAGTRPDGEDLTDWPIEDQTGEPDVEAAPAHAACSTTHDHPHPTFGTQGNDQTHSHAHTHQNDAVHNHKHAAASTSAAPAVTPTEGAPEVEFSEDQLAQIRAKLGKNENEPITAADIAAAFAAPTVAASAGAAEDLPPIGDGTYLVDGEILRDYQTRAARGDAAAKTLRVNERDRILAEAVRVGKFSQARLPHFEMLWDNDPEGARRMVDALAAGLVPMGGQIGTPGADPDLPGDFDEQQAYSVLFPEDVAAARAKRAAGASRGGI